jgi:hypothetical protein
MSVFVRLIVGVVLVLVSTLPSDAVQPKGSAAWTTDGWVNFDGALYEGPGRVYPVVADVPARVRVRVTRCSERWCLIRYGRSQGWLPIEEVSFGQYPDGFLAGPRFPNMHSGSGTVCFFTGAHYTGREFCAESGHVYKDLLLTGYDNAFASVKIGGAAEAMVCRDRNFRSYCKIIDVDTLHLEGLLNHAISSIRIY